MTPGLILVLGALTYLSRAAALVAMPVPSARLEQVLNRIPAPLFGGLAALSLIQSDGSAASTPVLIAAGGALLAAPSRSLLVVLVGGLLGYILGVVVA